MILNIYRLAPLLAAMAASAAPPTHAQTLPDAGQVQRETQPHTLQLPAPPLEIKLNSGTPGQTPSGGPKALVKRVEFSGNTAIPTDRLEKIVADQLGQPLDLAGLRGLTERISAVYQAVGYPFARAFLLPQTVQDGVVRIGIVEGRYGQIKVEGEAKLSEQAQPYLNRLKNGEVIHALELTRTLLILADQPGVEVSPLIRPGQEVGTGDLLVSVTGTPSARFEVGYDNHGTRYTGHNRLRVNAFLDSPLMLGDQISFRGVYSDGDLWLGSLAYGLPLGYSGLRALASASRTSYTLGKDFASLDASGTADTMTLGLSYPLVRLTTANATLSATLQRKELHDIQRAVETDERKSSQSLPLMLQLDRRDSVGGGGITFGSLTFTLGKLKLEGLGLSNDAATGRGTRGSFSKWNLDVARLQTLVSGSLSLLARVSAQQARKNLDSSEKFSLGGPNGVRAFPVGEGNGDSGASVQLELRKTMGAFAPYAFFDAGRVTLNARNGRLVAPITPNTRSIAGAGVGVRVNHGTWSLDGFVARSTSGGPSQSERGSNEARAWLTVTNRF